ncbi:DNA-directed RNA polymerase RBP11-like dimerization domain-containing protein [Plasmodiophora brassicae]|nr:hypothetical protein PBRA_002088 [Plasmodiophora brassicae]
MASDPTVRRDGIPKLRLEGNADETCATFFIEDEDHTLGNAARYIMAKSLDVEFVGYSVPHPTEHRMNIRVQTTGSPATQALRTSMEALISMCDHIKRTYRNALEQYDPRDGPE